MIAFEKEIGDHRIIMPRIRGLLVLPMQLRPNPVFFHKPGNPVLAAAGPLFSKRVRNSRAAIDPPVPFMDLLDAAQELLILP